MIVLEEYMSERKNKFDEAVKQLNEQEKQESEKSDKVVKKIAGKGNRKAAEERKVLPTYIPMSLYEQFDAITKAYGISNNAAICQMIRDYVTEKKGVLDEI